jgi:hypothetical protein
VEDRLRRRHVGTAVVVAGVLCICILNTLIDALVKSRSGHSQTISIQFSGSNAIGDRWHRRRTKPAAAPKHIISSSSWSPSPPLPLSSLSLRVLLAFLDSTYCGI